MKGKMIITSIQSNKRCINRFVQTPKIMNLCARVVFKRTT
jgi:hypothetical protein